jgi:hypothetical protein
MVYSPIIASLGISAFSAVNISSEPKIVFLFKSMAISLIVVPAILKFGTYISPRFALS